MAGCKLITRMPLTTLEVQKVGIFDKIDFAFDPKVNVFVGPNNSGKTTALFTLADILVLPFDFPVKHIRKGSKFTVTYRVKGKRPGFVSGPLPIRLSEEDYWTKERAKPLKAIQKQLGFRMFIPAVRISS